MSLVPSIKLNPLRDCFEFYIVRVCWEISGALSHLWSLFHASNRYVYIASLWRISCTQLKVLTRKKPHFWFKPFHFWNAMFPPNLSPSIFTTKIKFSSKYNEFWNLKFLLIVSPFEKRFSRKLIHLEEHLKKKNRYSS